MPLRSKTLADGADGADGAAERERERSISELRQQEDHQAEGYQKVRLISRLAASVCVPASASVNRRVVCKSDTLKIRLQKVWVTARFWQRLQLDLARRYV